MEVFTNVFKTTLHLYLYHFICFVLFLFFISNPTQTNTLQTNKIEFFKTNEKQNTHKYASPNLAWEPRDQNPTLSPTAIKAFEHSCLSISSLMTAMQFKWTTLIHGLLPCSSKTPHHKHTDRHMYAGDSAHFR